MSLELLRPYNISVSSFRNFGSQFLESIWKPSVNGINKGSHEALMCT